MGAKAWDLNAYFLLLPQLVLRTGSPGGLSRGAAQGQFVVRREEGGACSETLTLPPLGYCLGEKQAAAYWD